MKVTSNLTTNTVMALRSIQMATSLSETFRKIKNTGKANSIGLVCRLPSRKMLSTLNTTMGAGGEACQMVKAVIKNPTGTYTMGNSKMGSSTARAKNTSSMAIHIKDPM